MFYSSLVCNVERGARLISYEGVGQQSSYIGGRQLQGYGVITAEQADVNRGDCPRGITDGVMPCPETAAFVCRDFDEWSPAGCSGAEVRTWCAFPDHGVVEEASIDIKEHYRVRDHCDGLRAIRRRASWSSTLADDPWPPHRARPA